MTENLGIRRLSSRRHSLERSFLCDRLQHARAYDRIAGYFCSSLLEVVGEQLESVSGDVRMVCNSDLTPADVATARAAQMAVRRAWCGFEPEKLLDGVAEAPVRERYARLFKLLRSGKLQVRLLPDKAFGLIHGKAGVITLADGSKTSFMGSANESRAAWQMNYELVWEDTSPDAVHGYRKSSTPSGALPPPCRWPSSCSWTWKGWPNSFPRNSTTRGSPSIPGRPPRVSCWTDAGPRGHVRI